MKNRLLFSALALASLLLACEASDLLGSLTATIDGESFTSDVASARREGDYLVIAGYNDGTAVLVSVPDSIGNYNMTGLTDTVPKVVFIPDTALADNSYFSFEGYVNLDELSSSRLSGSFSAKAVNTNQDTIDLNGEFKNILMP